MLAYYRRLMYIICLPSRDGAARKLAGLITQRSQVQILFPLPNTLSTINSKASNIFASFDDGIYKPNIASQKILTQRQRLWGIFTALVEIDKTRLLNMKCVKHMSKGVA